MGVAWLPCASASEWGTGCCGPRWEAAAAASAARANRSSNKCGARRPRSRTWAATWLTRAAAVGPWVQHKQHQAEESTDATLVPARQTPMGTTHLIQHQLLCHQLHATQYSLQVLRFHREHQPAKNTTIPLRCVVDVLSFAAPYPPSAGTGTISTHAAAQ